MALLHIIDASGRKWQFRLSPQNLCTIGRAPDNAVVLNDPRASRYHAHIKFQDGQFQIVDGKVGGGRSANHVFVRGEQRYEHTLADGDRVQIGASELRFDTSDEGRQPTPSGVNYDDRPLGQTQLRISTNDVLRSLQPKPITAALVNVPGSDLKALQRKSTILALLYEMSKTLGSVFNLDAIFSKATEVIFSATPADRVVALLRDESADAAADVPEEGSDEEGDSLRVVSMRVRDERREAQAKQQPIGRTVTRKVMRERTALLSQDAAADMQFANVHSIVSQGVRSTICAPLLVEQNVYGALYADRLDAFTTFTRDDLELISAVAAQTAVAVENARSHERLAREEVARANYQRFLPEYVVKQLLENPDSFKLGGASQTITVLFADIRGFTRLSEHAPPEQVVQLLNKYFSAMTEIIFEHGGTLDKYIGDELMALFGAPTATPDDASNAVTTAVRMQREMPGINAELRAAGLPEVHVGIGLHTGEAVVGYIGSERRSEYTAIGDTVNLASRLQSNAGPGQVLISEATAQAARRIECSLHPREAIYVKNRVQPVPI
ncbi:MAG TPA: adenylate/guanylate cyclase domain-containing protein, partial [Pyrinomonadaceae bacterium]|nr:adenylate/guanylate cyclase domain-containing protein [Pyrinomonadaceae bacterium]